MTPITETMIKDLRKKLANGLVARNVPGPDNSVPGPRMTPAAETLLATVQPGTAVGQFPDDHVWPSFQEYFRFMESELRYDLPLRKDLLTCLGEFPPTEDGGHSCVRAEGIRGLGAEDFHHGDAELNLNQWVRRLYVGDVLWLYFHERMGVFKMIGALLDDYASRGKFPLPSAGVQAFLLETMTRELKTGSATTVRDRNATYRRCCGLDSDVGAKLGSEAILNGAFNERLQGFFHRATTYYRERNLASAVQSLATASSPSVATLTGVREAIDLLKQSFDPFLYGRNAVNTLNGIVWTLSGMALLRDLRTAVGVPPEYVRPHQYVPAAYNVLIEGSGPQGGDGNRYTAHRDCAITGRDLLIQLEALNHQDSRQGGELEVWLVSVEDKVETFRANYRTLTGVDLGSPGVKLEAAG